MAHDKNIMVILSSPSGVGKTTLTKKIQQKYQSFKISVSHTTRKPRSNEVEGVDYYFVTQEKFEGLISKKKFRKVGFDIRFHLLPDTNAIKTQDKQSILLQLKKSGWRFTCNHKNFGVETGLYFGKKDSYSENKNIYVHGEIASEEEIINWEIQKI